MKQYIWKPEGMFPDEYGAWLCILEVDAARAADRATIAELQAKCQRLDQDRADNFQTGSNIAKLLIEARAEVLQQGNRIEQLEAANRDLCERICASIKAADDESASLNDYMYDSNDCIRIVRETFSALAAADGAKGGSDE